MNINITLSVGQSKIGAGAIDRFGNEICRLDEIVTPRDTSSRYAAVVQQIVAVLRKIDPKDVGYVGISFPELVPPPSRFVADPEALPSDTNPIREAIAELLARELGTSMTVEVLHDAAAAALGEVSPKGTLPGCRNCTFIVWGTGVASGIIKEGHLYWQDPLIDMMTGEAGLQVIRKADGTFEYRPSTQVPELADAELRFDRWLRGPETARRFRQRIGEDARGQGLLAVADKTVDVVDLVDINRAARRGDAFAIELIESAGHEMGRALTSFIYYWLVEREMAFAENIIIGSGVAKLGDGLEREGKGVLITAIRNAIDEELISRGVDSYDSSKVILSRIGYEREFYAFIPTD